MQERRSLRVAVIGCGTAGPAASVLLARLGHEIDLFERAEVCRPVGAGFLLQPSGMAVLEELEILEPVLAKAAKVRRMHVVDPQGASLMDLRYRELGEGCFGAGLHRPVLLEALLGATERAGVSTRWDCEIVGARREGSKRSPVAGQGRWELEDARGGGHGPYDLLVVADGARSKLRALAGGGGLDRGYPWGAHWFIGRNEGVFPEDELYQVVRGTGRLCGFLATGSGSVSGERLVSLFWSVRVDEDATWRRHPLDAWKTEVLKLCPAAEGLLAQVGSWDDVLLARYGDVRMHRWHGDGIVVLGDAAHAMSPQLGQGVNLALADASCLARCLAKLAPQSALAAYTRSRRANLAYYQLATRWLTPWFQSDYEWLAPSRRLFFRTACRVTPARRFMVRTMAGEVFCGRSWRGSP